MRALGVRLHPEHVSASDHVQKYRRQGLVLIKSEEPQIWERTSKKLPPLRPPPGGLARLGGACPGPSQLLLLHWVLQQNSAEGGAYSTRPASYSTTGAEIISSKVYMI